MWLTLKYNTAKLLLYTVYRTQPKTVMLFVFNYSPSSSLQHRGLVRLLYSLIMHKAADSG